MSLRKIVHIDEEKCDGCGLCATSCAEGAIQIIDGKARLVAEFYCDGLGACLGSCPRGAITIEERQAADFDEEKTKEHLERLKTRNIKEPMAAPVPFTCPGSVQKTISKEQDSKVTHPVASVSCLLNWPVKLRLVSAAAPFLKNADLLVVADCVPFAFGNIHESFMQGKVVLAGCPKFDDAQAYVKKLGEIFKAAKPKSVTVLKMIVPCCGGLVRIVENALSESGMNIPVENVTINIEGEITAK